MKMNVKTLKIVSPNPQKYIYFMKNQPKKIKELSEMQKSSQVMWENQPTWFLKKEQENGWIQLHFVISRTIKYQVEVKTIDKLMHQ